MASVKRKSIESQQEDRPLLPPQKQLREDHSNNNSSSSKIIGHGEAVACLHDVSFPENYVRPSSSSVTQIQKDSKPAKEFPFTLDPFQSEAISCLDSGQSVMVIFFPFPFLLIFLME
jgi:ATP-dependent RNA helicase DOB1